MSTAKAAVMVKPGEMETREFELAKIAEDEILLKIDRAGICGTDKHIYHGRLPLEFPIIPGHEFTGTVVEMGSKAAETIFIVDGPIKEGDKVAVTPSSSPCGKCYWCLNYPHRTPLCKNRTIHGMSNCERPPYLLGGFGEYVYIRPGSWLFKVPEDMDYEIAVLTEPSAVALRAVERALCPGIPSIHEGFGIGQTAMVLGAGPIGLLVLACLKQMGATDVIVSDLATDRLEVAKKFGADYTINAGETSLDERMEMVLDSTDGVGVNVVFECVGVPAAFAEALDYVCRGGTLMELGHFTDTGTVEISPHKICNKDADIHGCWAYPIMEFRSALQFLRKTKLPVKELLTNKFPIEKAEEGINAVGGKGVLKVVIEA